jgi:hypothetical protein
MNSRFLKIAALFLGTLVSVQQASAQAGAILGATAAGIGVDALTKGSPATKAAFGVGAAIVGGLLGSAYDQYAAEKKAQADMDKYLLGRYQEGYIEAFSPWYKATLEPTTGRPPSFDGYWAMDIGMPNPGITAESPAQIATDRQRFESSVATLPTPLNDKDPTVPAATSIVTSRPKKINGVEYAPKKVVYPRLPARQP